MNLGLIRIAALAALAVCAFSQATPQLAQTTRDGRLAPLLANLGNLHSPVTTKSRGGAALFRPGPDAGLRIQPRRSGAFLPGSRAARSKLRDGLLGTGAGTRSEHQRSGDRARPREAGLRRYARGAAEKGAVERSGTCAGRRARAALRGGGAAGPGSAEPGLCESYDRCVQRVRAVTPTSRRCTPMR